MEYRFIDKDPVIDIVRHAFRADRGGKTIKQVAKETRVSESTIKNWLYGKTRRPQQWAIEQVLTSLGVDILRVWAESHEPVVVEVKDKRPLQRPSKVKRRTYSK